MGGGNAQKTAMARAKNQAKASAQSAGGSLMAQGQSFANEFSNVYYYNAGDLFCTSTSPTATCMANVPGMSLLAYFDQDHLSTIGAHYLWPYLCAAFQAFGFMTG